MTNQQYKICRKIVKHKKLNVILEKAKISDYIELQIVLGPDAIEFEDIEDDNTEIFLSNALTEELEQRHHQRVSEWITRLLAVVAIIISIIALFRS